MSRLSEGLIFHVRQHEIVWKYIIWTYSGTEEADLWQSRQSRSAFTSLGMKADLKYETTDLLQSRQKGSAKAELPIFGNEGRVLVEKPIFRSLAVKTERKCRSMCKSLKVQAEMKCGSGTSHLWKSWQNKCGKRNFRSLPVKAEQKCRSRTAHIWQSRQGVRAEAELHIFGSQCRTKVRTWKLQIFGSKDRAEAELQIFCSQGRAEVRKRNIRSLAVKAEQKCGSGISDL